MSVGAWQRRPAHFTRPTRDASSTGAFAERVVLHAIYGSRVPILSAIHFTVVTSIATHRNHHHVRLRGRYGRGCARCRHFHNLWRRPEEGKAKCCKSARRSRRFIAMVRGKSGRRSHLLIKHRVEKYRPNSLDDVEGHKDIITTINKFVDSNVERPASQQYTHTDCPSGCLTSSFTAPPAPAKPPPSSPSPAAYMAPRTCARWSWS